MTLNWLKQIKLKPIEGQLYKTIKKKLKGRAFYQVRVDILYEPDNENKMFNEVVWDEDLSENIFDYILIFKG